MRIDGIELAEGSEVKNLSVDTGTEIEKNALASPNEGELFYQTDGSSGLYTYTGSAWSKQADSNDIGVNVQPFDANTLKSDTTDELTVGYTTGTELLASDSPAIDMSTKCIKHRTLAGNFTVNFPIGGNGVCHVVLTVDGTDRTITLAANVKSVGTIPTLTASTVYLMTVIRNSATNAIVQFQAVSA